MNTVVAMHETVANTILHLEDISIGGRGQVHPSTLLDGIDLQISPAKSWLRPTH